MSDTPAPVGGVGMGRLALFWLVAIVVLLLGLELCARLLLRPRSDGEALVASATQRITAEGLPALTRVLQPDTTLFWRLKSNLRDFPVVGALDGKPLSFRVSSGAEGLREPCPIASTRKGTRILAIGDSTTFGLGVNDSETWPAQLAAQKSDSIEVINAGVPGYTAFQGLRVLQVIGESLSPDVVVATFWVNDMATWAARSDAETAQILLQKSAVPVWLEGSSLFMLARQVLRKMEPPSPAAVAGDRPRLTETEFTDALRGMAAWCEARKARLLLVLWPTRQQIEEKQTARYGYQPLIESVAREKGIPLVDLQTALRDANVPLFVDNYHANAEGCRRVAEIVAGTLHNQK